MGVDTDARGLVLGSCKNKVSGKEVGEIKKKNRSVCWKPIVNCFQQGTPGSVLLQKSSGPAGELQGLGKMERGWSVAENWG